MIEYLFNLDVEGLFFFNNLIKSSDFIYGICFYLAKWGVLIYIIFVLILWFEKTNKKKIIFNHKVVYITVLALILGFFLDQIISILVNRPRPFIDYPELYRIPLGYDSTSFPSTHTLNLFAISLSVYLVDYKKYGLFLILLAILIGLARVAGGIHYPSDILGGILIGGLAAFLIASKNSIIRKQLFKSKNKKG